MRGDRTQYTCRTCGEGLMRLTGTGMLRCTECGHFMDPFAI